MKGYETYTVKISLGKKDITKDFEIFKDHPKGYKKVLLVKYVNKTIKEFLDIKKTRRIIT